MSNEDPAPKAVFSAAEKERESASQLSTGERERERERQRGGGRARRASGSENKAAENDERNKTLYSDCFTAVTFYSTNK